MGSKTKINWTDATWSPISGCSHTSPGCANCYAEAMTRRFDKDWKPWTAANAAHNVRLYPERLEQPLHWRKPRRIFVCSMGDLFHEQVPPGFIDRVFAVMGAARNHVFQLLTKRPQRMLSYIGANLISGPARARSRQAAKKMGVKVETDPFWISADLWQWPLPNVWLGVTAENQRAADERIPLLHQTPAARRFVSCEPLLEQIDLSRYLYGGEVNCHNCKKQFLSWVADYCDGHECDQCRSARSVDDCCILRTCTDEKTLVCPNCDSCACGRIYEWGSKHRMKKSSGRYAWEHSDLKWSRLLDQIIVGGESGSKARPMNPAWPRSIRNQCQAAKVPFFFKQWGHWAPFLDNGPLPDNCSYVGADGTIRIGDAEDLDFDACMGRVGKKAAGRELDGRTWDEAP